VADKSKKQLQVSTNGTTKPETQWFCENTHSNFHLAESSKTKCHCFFDEHRAVRSHIAGLTKRFGYFGAPKYHAPAALSGKRSLY